MKFEVKEENGKSMLIVSEIPLSQIDIVKTILTQCIANSLQYQLDNYVKNEINRLIIGVNDIKNPVGFLGN